MDKDEQTKLDHQKEKYSKQYKDYMKFHGTFYSQKYRDIFMRDRIFSFNLSGKKVLDAMCAYGTETEYLIKKGAIVTGLDISVENAHLYQETWKLKCKVGSVHKIDFPNESFDVVYVCGGLHHVLYLLDDVIKEIHRILKPGGYFCFVEPNQNTWVNFFRKIWYRLDKRFTEDENAINYQKTLKPFLKLGYKEKFLEYGGGIGYILFVQSMILRIPESLKKIFWKPVCFLEKKHHGKSTGLFFLATWQKTK
jgi:SAM-dependent methyltransferase